MAELNAAERLAWLRLARSPKIGPVTFQNLLTHFGSTGAAIDAAPTLARNSGAPLKICPPETAEQELEQLEKIGGHLLASCEPEYPRALRALEAPPPVISVLGHPVLLGREAVAIVGARNASVLGRKMAEILARDLGKAGLVITSGLARGIDAAAHQASLATGTIAVVAGGVDQVWPPENADLYATIREAGCIVSEMPFGLAPRGPHFPRRNRIISGLSRGVIVVEAAERSGSLISARYALEQNREIFAVPGAPLDPRAHGTNQLICEGATLTQSADDVLAVLEPIIGTDFCAPEPAWQGAGPAGSASGPAGSASGSAGLTLAGAGPSGGMADNRAVTQKEVLESLSPAPVAPNDIIRETGIPAGILQTILLELEISGKITRHPGGKVSCP